MQGIESHLSKESTLTSSLVPFIIGVTGHRDPCRLQAENASTELIKQAIKDCILYWRKKLGKETPIWLMSGMAEGCDLLAVQAIEELRISGMDNFEIIPCLPMAPAEYEKDFTTTPTEYLFGLSGFSHHLHEHQHNMIVVSEQFQENQSTLSANHDPQQLRNSQYLNAGLFIAKYSHVLIALWDGNVSGGLGGTADIVRYKCGDQLDWCKDKIADGLRPHSEFDGQIGGAVQHITISRWQSDSAITSVSELVQLEHKDYTDSPYPLYVSYSSNKQANPIQVILSKEFALLNKQLIRFNTFAESSHVDNTQPKIAGVEQGLKQSAVVFYQADASALAYQTKYLRNLERFIIVACCGFFSYELTSVLLDKEPGIFFNVSIVVCILVLLLLIKQEKKNQTKIKYQTFRCVAEALRIRSYLNLAKVPSDVNPIIPRRYRDNWPIINYAFRFAELVPCTQTVNTNISLVKTEWLQGQIDYLNSRLQLIGGSTRTDFLYKRPKKAAAFLARWSRRAFILAIIVATLLIAIQIDSFMQNENKVGWHSIYTMLAVQFALMAGAVMALWQELANYQYTYNGYENLRMLYIRVLYLLDKEHEDVQTDMLLALAQEAMEEHAVWNHSEHQTDLIHR